MRPVKMTTLRRSSQIVFFLLFLFLLLHTEFRGSLQAAGNEIRLPYPIRWFFEIDPLVAVSNVLSSRALYRGLLWSLAILIPTMFLGRFFCGWICPLGSIHHFFGSLRSERKRGKQLIESNRYKRWQTTKYYLLFGLLVAALMGTGVVGWMDPLSLLVRSLGLSILPGTSYALRAVLHSLEASRYGLEGSRFGPVQSVGSVLHFIFGWLLLLSLKQPYFRQGIWLGAIFVFLLALNFRVTRFWCRALCPLGALLGIASRWAVLGLVKNPEHCKDCNRCLLRCQGGDDPIGGVPWRQPECHLCLNCVGECPEHGLQFKFFYKQDVAGVNLQRRKVLTSLGAGAALVPLMRATPGFATEHHERLLRPPGALDEGYFLSRCIRCGECMKACPNNALHPAWNEAGVEGLWTPVMIPRIGYCETSCVLCSQVCPTGAIWEITFERKGLGVQRDSGRQADPVGYGVLRPRPMPALGHGDRVHCLRGVVSHIAQGDLPAASRSGGCGRQRQATEATLSRSCSLCRLWRLRICLSAPGSARRLRHQHWRKPIPNQPNPAQPE
jgi:polyferredoxin